MIDPQRQSKLSPRPEGEDEQLKAPLARLQACPRCRRMNRAETRVCNCGFWLVSSKQIEQIPDFRPSAADKLKRTVRKFLILASFVIFACVGFALMFGYTDVFHNSENEEKANLPDENEAGPNERLFSNSQFPKGKIEGKVVTVESGDSITILDRKNQQHQIKLGGIIAPGLETAFGVQSKENLARLILDQKVTVKLQKIGENGTLIGKVFLDGLNINYEQLTAGLARHDQNIEQAEDDRLLYAKAETLAREQRAGLWSVENSPVSPDSQTVAALDPAQAKPSENRNETAEPTAEETLPPDFSSTAPQLPENRNSSTPVRETTPEALPSPSITLREIQDIPLSKSPDPAKVEKKTADPARATARCSDGTLSYSRSRSGACSNHGGVAAWLDGGEIPPAKIESGGKTYIRGPRGGCYYINGNGKKSYVDQSLCN